MRNVHLSQVKTWSIPNVGTQTAQMRGLTYNPLCALACVAEKEEEPYPKVAAEKRRGWLLPRTSRHRLSSAMMATLVSEDPLA